MATAFRANSIDMSNRFVISQLFALLELKGGNGGRRKTQNAMPTPSKKDHLGGKATIVAGLNEGGDGTALHCDDREKEQKWLNVKMCLRHCGFPFI